MGVLLHSWARREETLELTRVDDYEPFSKALKESLFILG